MNSLLHYSRTLLLAAIALIPAEFALAQQGTVGTLQGEIRVGNDPTFRVNRGDIYASYQGSTVSKINFVNGNAGTYTMSLGTPAVPTVYQVSGELIFENGLDIIRFAPQPVELRAGEVSTFDLVIDEPAFIEGSVSVPGATISSASILVSRPDGSSSARTSTNQARSLMFALPVVPGQGLRITGTAVLSSGAEVFLSGTYLDASPGETVSVLLTANAPSMASVRASVAFPGARSVDEFRLQLSGPTFAVRNFIPHSSGLTQYLVEGLAVGGYSSSLRALLGSGDDEVTFPISAFSPGMIFPLIAGVEHQLQISTAQAELVGNLIVTGTLQPEDIESGQLQLLGVTGTAAEGGISSDRLSIPSLAYDAVVTAGSWYIDSLRLNLSRPESRGYLRQSFQLKDARTKAAPIVIAAGVSHQQDLAYRFSERVFNFEAPSGQVMSSPRVTYNCVRFDDSGIVLWSSTGVSYGDVNNVSLATVRVSNIDGECSFVADARISNVLTVLGAGRVSFEAGSEGSIDTGGPSVQVRSPAAELCTSDDSITVQGLATDDNFVEKILVNGELATWSSTENLTDPAEVSFSASVPLEIGTNIIETLISDATSLEAIDRRTVTRSDDSDQDGVLDCFDGCPSDPSKAAPGVCGCGTADVDSDGDSHFDCIDGCPSDPLKIEPGSCGCGVADIDSDKDKTLDCFDACPLDPLKVNPGVCGCGIADIDSDSDGVFDCSDQCPFDGDKVVPGECGCGQPDTDSDGDGVADCLDLCPFDVAKTDPGQCGCGFDDLDSDNDGVPDCRDECPSDSLKSLAGECGCGVADVDSDADGIPDCIDLCPNDPFKIAPGVCGCGTADEDLDGDGVYACEGDCNDHDPNIYPGAVESCGDPDRNCDGKVGMRGMVTIKTFEQLIGNTRGVARSPVDLEFYLAEANTCAVERCGRVAEPLRYACLKKRCQPVAMAGDFAGAVKAELAPGRYIALAQDSPQVAISKPFQVECGMSSGGEYHRTSLVLFGKVIPLIDWFNPPREAPKVEDSKGKNKKKDSKSESKGNSHDKLSQTKKEVKLVEHNGQGKNLDKKPGGKSDLDKGKEVAKNKADEKEAKKVDKNSAERVGDHPKYVEVQHKEADKGPNTPNQSKGADKKEEAKSADKNSKKSR